MRWGRAWPQSPLPGGLVRELALQGPAKERHGKSQDQGAGLSRDFIRLIELEEVLNRGNVVARHKKATERWHRAFNIISKTLMLLRRIRKGRPGSWTGRRSLLAQAREGLPGLQPESTYMGRSAASSGLASCSRSSSTTWCRRPAWTRRSSAHLRAPFVLASCRSWWPEEGRDHAGHGAAVALPHAAVVVSAEAARRVLLPGQAGHHHLLCVPVRPGASSYRADRARLWR